MAFPATAVSARGTLWPALAALIGLASAGVASGRDVEPPLGIAFDRGRDRPAVVNEAVARGTAGWVQQDVNRDVVRHLRVEVWEKSRESTRAQVSVFAVCETTFQLALNAGKQLQGVGAEFVLLDAFGRPIGNETRRLEVREEYRGGRWVWLESSPPGRPLASFYRALPPWALRRLWLLSGYLDRNPGQPPVLFAPSVEEDLASVLSTLLGLTPGVARPALGQVVENLAKALAGAGLKKAVADDRLRWGGADDVTAEKARAHAEVYTEAGRKLWAGIVP